MTLRCLVKPLLLATCLVEGLVRPSSAAPVATDAQHPESHPFLLELRPRLEEVLIKTHPGATLEIKGSELVAQFKTRQFMVYSIRPNGEVSESLHEETGPLRGGFVLRLRVFPKMPTFANSDRAGKAYWREDFAYYKLRVSATNTPNFPLPPLYEDETAIDAIESRYDPFLGLAKSAYRAFEGLRQSGLLGAQYRGQSLDPLMTRYDATIEVARLLRDIPALQQSKSARLEALQKSIANINVDGIAEVEKLDNYLQELLIELHDDLQTIEARTGQPNPPQPAVGAWKPQYITMNFSSGLGTNAYMLDKVSQILTDYVREKNKASDELIHLEAAK